MKALLLALLCAGSPDRPELWLYHSTNLQVRENVDRLEKLWRRAAKAGYTKILLADSKFARLGDLGDVTGRYFAHLERVRKLARELKLEVVPAVFPVGYSNSILWHDPNLASGLPVKNALFVVRGGEARLVPDPPVAFGPKFRFKDKTVSIEGGMAVVRDNPGNARFTYELNLPKYRCYHVSVRIKTEDFTGQPEIKAIGDRVLTYTDLGVKRTQDWKEHHIVFNTLENERVIVYFGVWGAARGTLRWKDWKIEEAGLVNVLRRPGAPCVVEGRVEGRDYERIVDPKMGSIPWKGEYTVWHEPPPIRTKLPDGTRLRVSWYHPAIIYHGQVSACLSEPKFLEVLADQAGRMKRAWGAKGYMMSHDEIRTLNRDAACLKSGLDAGEILAKNARACVKLLGDSTVYVWSDMFDPHHNARKDYYLVRGDLAGSWKGLDPKVVIVNWNFGKRDKSLPFFAGRGHRQVLAAYYDGPVGRVREWLASAAKVKGVVGVMYTTWRSNYDDLEAFARICRE